MAVRRVSVLALLVFVSLLLSCSRATIDSKARAKQAASAGPSTDDGTDDEASDPGIGVDLPLRGIVAGQPFKISVWLDAADDGKTHAVYMDPSDSFEYTPAEFALSAGKRQTVIAKLKKNESGLAQINITSDGFHDFSFNVDAGFTGKLKAVTAQNMESLKTYPVTFSVVNGQDAPVHLDANALIRVRAVNGLLQGAPDQPWVPALKIPVLAGSTSSQAFLVKPSAITGEPVVLTASMYPWQNDVVISDQRLELAVMPAWWYTLALAILGGCIPPIYRFLTAWADTEPSETGRKKIPWARGMVKLITGAVAGVVAYLFAAWDIIGVKLDMSSSRTFLILGFLFSYIGVDVLMKRVLGQTQGAKDQDSDDDHQPEAPPERPAAHAAKAG